MSLIKEIIECQTTLSNDRPSEPEPIYGSTFKILM